MSFSLDAAITDEHIYKLVQVCMGQSKGNEDAEMEDVYKRAALSAMKNPLYFGF
jgi:hypothetical protein